MIVSAAKKKNSKRKAGSSDGFTMIEIVIAMVIASLIFVGIFSMSIQTMRILQATRSETRAVQAAQYEIEKLRSYSWSIIEAMPETTSVVVGQNQVLSVLNTGQGRIKKTLYQPHQIFEPMYAISVTISWLDFKSERDSKTVTSVITSTGMIK